MNGLVDDVLRAIGGGVGSGELLRVGIDAVSVTEFATSMARPGGADFVENSFTESEKRTSALNGPRDSRSAGLQRRQSPRPSAQAFGAFDHSDINVVHHPDGHPSVAPTDGSSWPDDADRWMWLISLCHEGDAAIAIAVGIINGGGGA